MADKLEETGVQEGKLPFAWEQVQSAIWLVGLAILFWRGWWWPGILILMAVSGLTQALFFSMTQREAEAKEAVVAQRTLEETRAVALPERCPACGGPLTTKSVIWKSNTTAACPWCTTAVKATRPAEKPPA